MTTGLSSAKAMARCVRPHSLSVQRALTRERSGLLQLRFRRPGREQDTVYAPWHHLCVSAERWEEPVVQHLGRSTSDMMLSFLSLSYLLPFLLILETQLALYTREEEVVVFGASVQSQRTMASCIGAWYRHRRVGLSTRRIRHTLAV
jgi:hypothetical protein